MITIWSSIQIQIRTEEYNAFVIDKSLILPRTALLSRDYLLVGNTAESQ